MKKKFECKQCHHTFEADDSTQVLCPKCHSDNVEYATWHLPKRIIYIVSGVLVLLLVVVFALCKCEKPTEEEIIVPVIGDSIVVSDIELEKELEEETGLKEPPSIVVGEKIVDDNGMYNFAVDVKHRPNIDFYYRIVDVVTEKVVSRSDDGKFLKVQPSTDADWRYYVQIVDSKADTVICSQVDDGYVKIEKVDSKMTPEQLQKLINDRDESLIGVGENKYLSPVCTLHFKGLPAGAAAPAELADVLEKLDMEVWKSVTVVSLDYDDTKHISSITFNVKVNNMDF